MSGKQENATVNEDTGDQETTVDNPSKNLAAREMLVKSKTLERCFNEGIGCEKDNIVDTVGDRIQKAILIAIDDKFTPEIELEIRSKNGSSGRDVTSVMANSEHDEHKRVTAFFENGSKSNTTLYVFNSKDEYPKENLDKVGELSVPGTDFDRQPHSHQTIIG